MQVGVSLHLWRKDFKNVLGGSRHFLAAAPALLGRQGIDDVGVLGVELHHVLSDEGVLAALGLQLLTLLHQVGVGQHLAVLRHLLDHSLVVALNTSVMRLHQHRKRPFPRLCILFIFSMHSAGILGYKYSLYTHICSYER